MTNAEFDEHEADPHCPASADSTKRDPATTGRGALASDASDATSAPRPEERAGHDHAIHDIPVLDPDGDQFPPLDADAFERGTDDACSQALARVHAFLTNELPASQADLIRAHLDACEKCLDDFDIEATISQLIKRTCQGPCAPDSLRLSIMTMRVDTIAFDD